MATTFPTNIEPSTDALITRFSDVWVFSSFMGLGDHNTVDPERGDIVFAHSRPKVGLTTAALEFGRDYLKPNKQRTFPGGVFYVDLINCNNPKDVYSNIIQSMGILKTHSYWDNKEKKYIAYPQYIQAQIYNVLTNDIANHITPSTTRDYLVSFGFIRNCQKLLTSNDNRYYIIPFEIYYLCYDYYHIKLSSNRRNANLLEIIQFEEYIDDNSWYKHYIFLNAHKEHKELLKYKLPQNVFEQFEKKEKYLPFDLYFNPKNDEKILIRQVKVIEQNDDDVLSMIDGIGLRKLFIIDHVSFPDVLYNKFLQKIEKLFDRIWCKVLICCHDQKLINKVLKQNLMFQKQIWRIKPISKKNAASHLLDTSRQLYEFDFRGLSVPSHVDQMADIPLIEWLSRSPALISQCSFCLNQKVPFFVINEMIDSEPNKWKSSLNEFWKECKLKDDQLNYVHSVLDTLLMEIDRVRNIWKDEQVDDKSDI